jgi:Zn-dependent protease with chaperone function
MLSKPRVALFIVALIGTVITSSTSAQSYQPLRSQGPVPEEFRSVTATKVQQAQAEDRSNQRTKEERKHVNEFLLKANYVIDEMLASGKILFGDPVTQYLNDLADVLLEDDPQLRSKVKLYAVKSSDANAFATKQGLIFVTLGLISQVENEAQLAFVLAHEIAHFQKDHSINSVLENIRIVNETSADRYNGSAKRIQLLSTFSKEMEFEADSLGFIRFVLSGYNKYDASSAMDVLYLSSLPYTEKPFESKYFSFGLTPFGNDFQLDSIRPFPYGSDDYDDSKSSHPNIRKRKSKLDAMADQSRASANTINLLPIQRFESIQRTTRDELIHLFLQSGQYVDALYSAYVRVSDEPDNIYLQESIAKSLYGISNNCIISLRPFHRSK